MRREAEDRKAGMARGAIALACGVALFWGALGIAYAGLFDDVDARRMIAAEKKRIDELNAEVTRQQEAVAKQQEAAAKQQEAVDARIARLEEASKNQAVLDLFTQLEAFKLEMNKLRGQIEVLNNNIETAGKRQRDMYIDLDTRLRRIEQYGAAAPAPAAPAASTPAPSTAAGPAITAPPTSASPQAAPAPMVVGPVAVDQSGEIRAYEAAQGQRRIGNYQAAIVAFQNFLKQYPNGSLAPRAQYWIGDSYFNLRDFRLAIASQQTLIRNYPDSPSVPDAMLNIASSQAELGETNAARKTLEELVAKYPVSEAADKAKRRLTVVGAPPAGGSVGAAGRQ